MNSLFTSAVSATPLGVNTKRALRWASGSNSAARGREMVVVANYSDKELPFDGGEDGLRFKLAAGEIRIVKQ